MLDGNDYKARKFAIKKCSTIAKVQGFPAFALENGGQCLGGKDILQTYNMYGASGACKPDGRGGPWSMEVYKFASRLKNAYLIYDDVTVHRFSFRPIPDQRTCARGTGVPGL